MAFDINTAQPIQPASGGFDLSSAQPVRQNVGAEPQKTFGGFASNVYRDVPALYGELVHAVTNPTQTVKGITKLLAGATLHTITPEGVKQIGDFLQFGIHSCQIIKNLIACFLD